MGSFVLAEVTEEEEEGRRKKPVSRMVRLTEDDVEAESSRRREWKREERAASEAEVRARKGRERFEEAEGTADGNMHQYFAKE